MVQHVKKKKKNASDELSSTTDRWTDGLFSFRSSLSPLPGPGSSPPCRGIASREKSRSSSSRSPIPPSRTIVRYLWSVVETRLRRKKKINTKSKKLTCFCKNMPRHIHSTYRNHQTLFYYYTRTHVCLRSFLVFYKCYIISTWKSSFRFI